MGDLVWLLLLGWVVFPFTCVKATFSLSLLHTNQIKDVHKIFNLSNSNLGKGWGNGTSIRESIFKFLNASKDDLSRRNGDVIQTMKPLVPLSLHRLTKWDFKSNFPKYHHKDIYVWPDGSGCQILMAFVINQTKVDPSLRFWNVRLLFHENIDLWTGKWLK